MLKSRCEAVGVVTLVFFMSLLFLAGCFGENLGRVKVYSTLEDRTPDGSVYSPATQSFLRGHHWLETVHEVEIKRDANNRGEFTFRSTDESHVLAVVNLPFDHLLPRLHYAPHFPPDDFDAYNLMMAEFSRNGLSVPIGERGDLMAHFESDLDLESPWFLNGDYNFIPNKYFRPFRVSIINNCLKPGLWEIDATDRAGEIYHAWFTLPLEGYTRLVARVNEVDEKFAAQAVQWSAEKRKLDLGRIRKIEESLGPVPITLMDGNETAGFSTQDSRQKLSKGFVQVMINDKFVRPAKLFELTTYLLGMSNFVEPGKYSLSERKRFDLAFLRQPAAVEVNRVKPLTHYDWQRRNRSLPRFDGTYLEIKIDFGEKKIFIGNLPVALLVQHEDFAIYGFGVGILPPSDLAERRKFLIEEGPAPSYAYLAEEMEGEVHGLNSHDAGIEQIFIRSRPFDKAPHWEIMITSFERIVDLIKYEVGIPDEILDELRKSSTEYISPLYFSYRDDNLH